jgi:hypothetical protein
VLADAGSIPAASTIKAKKLTRKVGLFCLVAAAGIEPASGNLQANPPKQPEPENLKKGLAQ